MKESLVIQKNC